jgi:hypothetical protein
MCSVVASTKRNTKPGGRRSGAAAAYLLGLKITPLWPASREVVRTLDLNSPREAKECYHVPAEGQPLPDVKEGDILVVNGVDYPIDWVGEWTDSSVPALHIVVSEVKRGQ